MVPIKRNHINIRLTKIPKYVDLKSQELNGMCPQNLRLYSHHLNVPNYSLSICAQPNFTVQECHINRKPHEEKINMQLNSESHLYVLKSATKTITLFSKSTFTALTCRFKKRFTHCSGLNCGTQKKTLLTPNTPVPMNGTLFRNRVFADTIKLRMYRCDHPGFKSNPCIFIREKSRRSETQTDKTQNGRPREGRDRDWSNVSTQAKYNQGCQESLQAGREAWSGIITQSLQRKTNSADNLTSRFWAPKP